MARRLKYPDAGQAQAAQAAASLETWAKVGKKPKKRPLPKPERARGEFRAMLTAGDFSTATPTHLVALYEWCHEQIYGVLPAELNAKAWLMACGHARRLIDEEFKGDVAATIDFIRWTWKREAGREKARRAGTNPNIGRIGWRLQFVTRFLVTDYRLDVARGRV